MFTNLSRATLPQQIVKTLLDYIANQNLQPGDILPSENTLAANFGVSRPVVREALKSLAGQGVVQIINGKGAVIRAVDDESLRRFFQRAVQLDQTTIVELMEIRKPLEVQSAFLAAQRRTPEESAQILATAAAMQEALHDLDLYADLDVRFHLQIVAATHNTMLVYLISSIREALKNTIQEGLRRMDTAEQLTGMQLTHQEIATAIDQGDTNAAGQLMTTHFDGAVMKLIKATATD